MGKYNIKEPWETCLEEIDHADSWDCADGHALRKPTGQR